MLLEAAIGALISSVIGGVASHQENVSNRQSQRKSERRIAARQKQIKDMQAAKDKRQSALDKQGSLVKGSRQSQFSTGGIFSQLGQGTDTPLGRRTLLGE